MHNAYVIHFFPLKFLFTLELIALWAALRVQLRFEGPEFESQLGTLSQSCLLSPSLSLSSHNIIHFLPEQTPYLVNFLHSPFISLFWLVWQLSLTLLSLMVSILVLHKLTLP